MAAVTGTTSVSDLKHLQGGGIRARIQRFGGYLAGMVMPNIGAFIAWGLITALFIPTGWLPNEQLAALVGPMITYLLPLLIGYTGGRLVHGQRGAVVGAVATMGVVVGADVPMFLGAMIIGPLAGVHPQAVRRRSSQSKIKAGFEMLVDNFSRRHHRRRHGDLRRARRSARSSSGSPTRAGDGVELARQQPACCRSPSIIVEPAKVLFLNNAINHGVLARSASPQAREHGKSILFMLESNPGPGLGLLLAYLFFGPRSLRPSVARPRSSSTSSAASTRSTSRTC